MICKLKLALIMGLPNLLDSALYLSLIVQIAGILYGNVNTVVGDPSELTQEDKDNFGGTLYDFRLVLYTSCITLCPVLTLVDTPYLRKSLSRRRFRLVLYLWRLVAQITSTSWETRYMSRRDGNTKRTEYIKGVCLLFGTSASRED